MLNINNTIHLFFFFLSFSFLAGCNDASWSGNDLNFNPHTHTPTKHTQLTSYKTITASLSPTWSGPRETWFGLIQTLDIHCLAKFKKFIVPHKSSSFKQLSMERWANWFHFNSLGFSSSNGTGFQLNFLMSRIHSIIIKTPFDVFMEMIIEKFYFWHQLIIISVDNIDSMERIFVNDLFIWFRKCSFAAGKAWAE